MVRILLIENEDNARKTITHDLKKADSDIVEYGDDRTAVGLAVRKGFDVLIIDWMLPHVSGIDIMKEPCSEHIDTIFIMLMARNDKTDILYAFEQSVDDYITKPFSPRELPTKANTHLKRQNRRQERRFSMGDLSMDMKRREVHTGGRMMTLIEKEFGPLECFIQNRDIVLSRNSILSDTWDSDYDGGTRIVDVHVFKPRDKLDASHVYIRSSRGISYLLEEVHGTQQVRVSGIDFGLHRGCAVQLSFG